LGGNAQEYNDSTRRYRAPYAHANVEMSRPGDTGGFSWEVPNGLEQQSRPKRAR